MEAIPHDKSLDRTIAIFREGYKFISHHAKLFESDVFDIHLMLQNVTCMLGEEAAQVFYDQSKFTRKMALPPTALRLLQDKRSVMVMDDRPHHHRKSMFISLLGEQGVENFLVHLRQVWKKQTELWQGQEQVCIQTEVENIICAAVCEWAGIPLGEEEVAKRAQDFSQMVDGSGSIGPRNWRGFLVRSRTERWIRDYVKSVRTGSFKPNPKSPAYLITQHRELDGELLNEKAAVEEIINLLRPTIAVARYVSFAVHALHFHPGLVEKLRHDDKYLDPFVQEVKRYYPFIPFLGGRVREDFEWRGMKFPKGKLVLSDVYGTNHDPRIWSEPHKFRPERFFHKTLTPYNLIPQGAGPEATSHRCPGERLTNAMLKEMTLLLTRDLRYEVPEQDLRIDLARIPARVNSGMAISEVGPYVSVLEDMPVEVF